MTERAVRDRLKQSIYESVIEVAGWSKIESITIRCNRRGDCPLHRYSSNFKDEPTVTKDRGEVSLDVTGIVALFGETKYLAERHVDVELLSSVMDEGNCGGVVFDAYEVDSERLIRTGTTPPVMPRDDFAA